MAVTRFDPFFCALRLSKPALEDIKAHTRTEQTFPLLSPLKTSFDTVCQAEKEKGREREGRVQKKLVKLASIFGFGINFDGKL